MTNKEAIKHLEGVALILKSRHMCKSMDGNCSHDEIDEYRKQFESIKIAIEALKKLEKTKSLIKEMTNALVFFQLQNSAVNAEGVAILLDMQEKYTTENVHKLIEMAVEWEESDNNE